MATFTIAIIISLVRKKFYVDYFFLGSIAAIPGLELIHPLFKSLIQFKSFHPDSCVMIFPNLQTPFLQIKRCKPLTYSVVISMENILTRIFIDCITSDIYSPFSSDPISEKLDSSVRTKLHPDKLFPRTTTLWIRVLNSKLNGYLFIIIFNTCII